MSNRQSSMDPGAQVTLTITDVAFGGDGVGRVDGMAVFVPFTCVGETVRVEIVTCAKRFARARLLDIIERSPQRVDPPCRWYGACAGCQYQHMAYEEQLRVKHRQVRELFRRIGRFDDIPLESIIASPKPYGYRSKIVLHGPGRPAFYGHDNRTRVPVEGCVIADERINDAWSHWLQAHPEGLARPADLHFRLSAGGAVHVHAGDGDEWITHSIAGRSFTMPVSSFFQVNVWVAERLAEYVVASVRESGCETLIDAYAGVGLFGLLCAADVKHAYAIESASPSVRAAKRNAREQGVEHMAFVSDTVERGLNKVLDQVDTGQTCCLLDPPRAGCAPSVLEALVRRPVRRVVYISCAPDGLARDVRRLVDGGYRLSKVVPFDMFPQTTHMETVAVLER